MSAPKKRNSTIPTWRTCGI